MISSILYCHKNCIGHRDLKPDNFMLSKKEEKPTIKLIDFGLSKEFYKISSNNENKDIIRMNTGAGTFLYMAPEVIAKNYSYACDIWSLGVILYIMLGKELPFTGTKDEEIMESIQNMDIAFDEEVWDTRSEESKDLIKCMLTGEDKRISLKKALNHPWFKKMLNTDSGQDFNAFFMQKFTDFEKANKFKKAILTYFASKVNDDEIREETEIFHSFDTNNDGYITK